MGISHLDQLTLSTGPVLPGGSLPIYTGNWLFVNETTGSDGNPGTADLPLKTLSAAHALATANQNDVVCFQGSIHLTATLVWSKNQVHLVGMDAPIKRGKRARISVTGTTAFTPMISVTANGCHLKNFGTFYGFNSASNNAVCVSDTGGRNCWDNVEVLGFGDNTGTTGTANIVGARALVLNTSTGETTFRNCVFGVDTATRNATNYTVEIAGGAPRVTFENCDFEALLGGSGGSSSHLLIGADGIDRYLSMVGCRFINAVKSGATVMTQLININGAAGGLVLMHDCTAVGCTHVETTPSNQVYVSNAAPSIAADVAIATNNHSA